MVAWRYGISLLVFSSLDTRREIPYLRAPMYYCRVSVKPGTHPEHPGTPRNTPGTPPEQPGTARNNPGTPLEHPIIPWNTLETDRNTPRTPK